jgi:hypothetical protein
LYEVDQEGWSRQVDREIRVGRCVEFSAGTQLVLEDASHFFVHKVRVPGATNSWWVSFSTFTSDAERVRSETEFDRIRDEVEDKETEDLMRKLKKQQKK